MYQIHGYVPGQVCSDCAHLIEVYYTGTKYRCAISSIAGKVATWDAEAEACGRWERK